MLNKFDGRDFDDTQIFGYEVATAGDVNGDGYDDIMISDNKWDNRKGKVFLFCGGTFVDNAADAELKGLGSLFGCVLSALGDLNKDGYDDIVISPSKSSYPGIFFGGDSMSVYPNLILDEYENGGSGSFAGDVNNDGYIDIIAGYVTPYEAGEVLLYLGGDPFDKTPDLVFYGEEQDYTTLFGNKLASAGDVNNDGYDDIIVGAENYDINLGRAYIFYGGNPMDNIPDVILDGEREQHIHFGNAVCSGKDINNDGFDDVVIGSLLDNGEVGKAYVYFGGSPMDDTVDVILQGDQDDDGFGFSVSADDFNGDGYSDVLVGAYKSRKAFVYFGGADMDNEADVVINGEDYSYYARSVSTAGDVNNDGRAEIIVGAWGAKLAFLYEIAAGGTNVESQLTEPNNYELFQNYPNPFNPSTKIKYTIPRLGGQASVGTGHTSISSREGKERSDRGVLVTLKIYNILGHEVTTLVNEQQLPGNYEVEFSSSSQHLVSGIYFYKLTAGNFIETKKMLLLK